MLPAAALAAPAEIASAGAPVEAAIVTERMAENWAEREVGKFVRAGEVTAAGVAVVADGRVVLARSYGWFDPVKRIEVQPGDQFLVGSITKSFVGLLIAKLNEQGRIRSLEDPANLYLRRYQVPRAFGAEVTIEQLATHTAGLESPGFRISSGEQRSIPATAAELQRWLPGFVRPPGFKAVYANFGPVILGALAEDLTGERFDRLMAREILGPLGLSSTTLGYDPTGGERLIHAGITGRAALSYAPLTINDPLTAPAGSIQSTPADMARYMNALLGHAPQVVSSAVLAEERKPRAVNYPGLSPIGLGVFLDRWNHTTVVGHGGLIAGFRSNMQIVPDRDLGVFVVFAGGHDAFNAGPGDPGVATDAFLREVLGPVEPLPPRPSTNSAGYAGRYWLELRAHTTPESLLGADRLTDVEVARDGGLLIGSPGAPKDHYTEVAPGLYQGALKNGRRPTLYGFEPGRLLANKMYSTRVSGLHDPRRLTIAAVALLAIALSGLARVVGGGGRRWAAVACGLGAAGFAYALVWPLLAGVIIDLELFRGDDWRFRVATGADRLLLLAGFAAVTLAVGAFATSGRRGWTLLVDAHLALVGVASIAFAAIGASFHLL
jgi:CubicO group peptidase (beta-lactamase class C family)